MNLQWVAMALIAASTPQPQHLDAPKLHVTGTDEKSFHFLIEGPESKSFLLERSPDLVRWGELYPVTFAEEPHTNAMNRLAPPQQFLRVVEDLPFAPADISGMQFHIKILDGRLPLAKEGEYRLLMRAERRFFIQSWSPSVLTGTGEYTYEKVEKSSAQFRYHEQSRGFIGVGTYSFESRYRGTITIIQTDGPGYQFGTFYMSPEE